MLEVQAFVAVSRFLIHATSASQDQAELNPAAAPWPSRRRPIHPPVRRQPETALSATSRKRIPESSPIHQTTKTGRPCIRQTIGKKAGRCKFLYHVIYAPSKVYGLRENSADLAAEPSSRVPSNTRDLRYLQGRVFGRSRALTERAWQLLQFPMPQKAEVRAFGAGIGGHHGSDLRARP